MAKLEAMKHGTRIGGREWLGDDGETSEECVESSKTACGWALMDVHDWQLAHSPSQLAKAANRGADFQPYSRPLQAGARANIQ